MYGPIYTELRLVRNRQQHLRVLRSAVLGLLASSLVVIGLVALGVALVLVVRPPNSGQVQAALPEPLPAIVDVAEEIEEDLKQIDALAREERNAALAQLVQRLREKLEEMKQPGVSEREA